MTDGPYAPPSMGRQWNAFARSIALPAFEEECRPGLRAAVTADVRRERVDEAADFLRRRLPAQPEKDLFGEMPSDPFNAARQSFPSPMAQSAINACEVALRAGDARDDAIDKGIASCLREDGRNGCSSIEHYLMNAEGAAIANSAHAKCDMLLRETDWLDAAKQVQASAVAALPDSDAPEQPDRLGAGPPL